MLRLHEAGETKFDGGCVAYLGNAIEVKLEKKINEMECVYFEYPCTDEKAAMIKENMIISHNGQGYVIFKNIRKTDGKDIISITAADLFSAYGIAKHIQNIPDMIGKKPSDVFKRVLKGTQFTMFTESELNERGMTWVDSDGYLMDFFSTDKTNVWEATKTIIENCGKGEIYRDNLKVAIVKRLGADNGVRLTLEKNMDGLEIMRDFEPVITRLYPYGADDMHIGSVNGGKQYIDSPNIAKYGIREGYKDYSDYTDPAKIKAHAEWEFDPENEDRIDIPKISITGGFIDLSRLPEYGDIEKVDIGDTVHVYDNDHNVYHQRIVAITTYPYEPKKPTIEIGHIEINTFSIVWNLIQKRKQFEKAQTANKSIAIRKVQGTVNTDRNNIQSENKQLLLNGDLLHIDDDNGRRRVEIGNVGGAFVFNLYDVNGSQVIHFNEKGDGTFSGTIRGAKIESDTDIQVTKDAAVGQYLRVGYITASVKEDGTVSYKYQDESGILLGPGASIKADNKGDNITVNAMGRIEFRATSVTKAGSELSTVQEVKNLIRQAIATHEEEYH